MSVPGQILDNFMADEFVQSALMNYAFQRLTGPTGDLPKNLLLGQLDNALSYHKIKFEQTNKIILPEPESEPLESA